MKSDVFILGDFNNFITPRFPPSKFASTNTISEIFSWRKADFLDFSFSDYLALSLLMLPFRRYNFTTPFEFNLKNIHLHIIEMYELFIFVFIYKICS